MRKGLITLLTVAIALAGAQAMAMAPVIGNVPSPVVGGQQTASQPQAYVFPDAFDLNAYVSDDATANTDLKWSYEVVGSSKYLINGVQPINSASTDPITVPTASAINKTDNETATGKDALANTISVRNQRLFPLGGTAAGSAGFTGIGDIQPVTLWCSDGTTASNKTVLFYTKSDSTNYLSQKKSWTKMAGNNFTTWDHSWKIADGPFGNVTTTTFGSTGGGMCFSVTSTGDNFASIVTGGANDVPYVTLTANTVYRVRARMNSSQPSPGKTPFWDFVLENWPQKGAVGLNLYASDWFYLDNENGANSVVTTGGGTWLNMYWVPLPVQAAGTNWSTLFSNSSYSARKDARLRFRVMDLDSSPVQSNLKFGQICMQEIVVETLPISQLTVKSTTGLPNFGSGAGQAKITAPNAGGTGNLNATSYFSATGIVYNSDGSLTVKPMGNGTSDEIIEITPQTTTGSGAYAADHWPIAWASNKLYELQVTVKAPTAADAASPFDVIWLNMESPTNEVNCETYVTGNASLGTPTTTASTYTMLYNTQTKTGSGTASFAFLRYRIRFGNAATLLFPSGASTNTGAAQITGVTLSELNVLN